MAAIDVESLRKSFGDVTALADLSLHVEAGELFGLLGPNGAGKTTTLEILTGQTVPDAGSVSVLGIEPSDDPIGVRQRVGILPEKESPPSLMSPREYLQFCGDIRDMPESIVDDGIAEWADRLGFVDCLDTLAADLSRGQQQKVMIAAAFVHDPEIVFIDEPLANLDPIVQERVKRLFVEYGEAGNTVVLSTHNVNVAAEVCTRVGILEAGRLVEDVDPGSLGSDRTLLDVFFDRVEDEERASHAA